MKTVLIILAGLLAGLLILIAMQPADFRVVRSSTMAAPPEKVFAVVNDFHQWERWSPWAKIDPGMKTTFEGPPAGPGAVYSWAGNDKVGEGKMTITDSQPGQRVAIKLDFIKPFASTNQTEFAFQGDGGKTNVVWTMTGTNNFLSKAFSLFMGGMDKMVGPDFEKGLAQMKSTVESGQ